MKSRPSQIWILGDRQIWFPRISSIWFWGKTKSWWFLQRGTKQWETYIWGVCWQERKGWCFQQRRRAWRWWGRQGEATSATTTLPHASRHSEKYVSDAKWLNQRSFLLHCFMVLACVSHILYLSLLWSHLMVHVMSRILLIGFCRNISSFAWPAKFANKYFSNKSWMDSLSIMDAWGWNWWQMLQIF